MRGAQPGRTSAKLLTAAILVLFLVSAVIFWNVNGLRRAIEHRTQSYLKDVSQQTAQLIDSRLHAATRALHLLAEGVARLDEEEAQDYLRESTKALSFSRVSLVNLQGEILSPDGPGEYLGDWDAFAGAVQGQDTCSVQEDELCYMVPVYEGDTVVGNDVWLGRESVVMPGVRIGDGAIVAAYSVVTKDVAPYTLVGGNPARFLKNRFDPQLTQLLLEAKWWDWDPAALAEALPMLCSPNLEQVKAWLRDLGYGAAEI